MLLLKYETFLQDKIQAIRDLASRLGLPVKRDIRPYLNRQYQPKGNYETDWLSFYGPENLSLIETLCRGKMLQYGYPLSAVSPQDTARI